MNKASLLKAMAVILMMGAGMNAIAGLFGFGGVSWKEEVLLHDGKTIMVERSQTYGSRPTLDSREKRVLEEVWSIPVPGTDRTLIWKTGFRTPPESPSLMLMLVDFIDGIPYLATSPAGCIAYNHWGRPNPPYVFFRHDGKDWRRIPLEEFPPQLKEPNVIVGRPDPNHRSGTLTRDMVKQDNAGLEPYHRAIAREPITKGDGNWKCPTMVYDGNGGWLGIDWFRSQQTYEACLKFCVSKKIDRQYCPCDSIFKRR